MFSKKKKAKALDGLKRFHGLPPYDDWSNLCYGDGYYAKNLVNEFGMSIAALMEVTGYNGFEKKWHTLKNKFIKENNDH